MKDKVITIQVLRAIASLIVVYVHAIIIAESTNDNISLFTSFYHFRDFGAFGVDIFFVLSGFIITYTSKERYKLFEDKVTFLKRRVYRVYPVYWIVLMIFVLLIIVKEFVNNLYPGIILDIEHIQTSELISSIFLYPHLVGNSFAVYLPSAWTLTYEIIFYITSFLSILIFSRISLRGIVLISLLSYFFFGLFIDNTLLNYVFGNTLIIEFVYGVIIAKIYLLDKEIIKNKNWVFIFYISIILYILTLFIPIEHGSNINPYRFIYWGIPAFILVLSCVFLNKKYSKSLPISLIFIGDASYSIYLTHVAITLPISNKIFSVLGLNDYLYFDFYILILVLVSVAFGSLFYLIIERPLLKTIISRGLCVIKHR